MNRSSVNKTSSRETITDRYVKHLESAQQAKNLPFGQIPNTKNVAACNQEDVNGTPCISDGVSGLDLSSLLGCECPKELQGIFVEDLEEEQEEIAPPKENLQEIEDTLHFLTEQIQKLQDQLVEEGVEEPEEVVESEETEEEEPEQECPGDPDCPECGEETGATEPCASCQEVLGSSDEDEIDVMSAFFGAIANPKYSSVNVNMLKSAALMGPEEKEKIVRIAVDGLRNRKSVSEILSDLVKEFIPEWVSGSDGDVVEGFINFFKECIDKAKVFLGIQPEEVEKFAPEDISADGLPAFASRKTEWLRQALKDGVIGS